MRLNLKKNKMRTDKWLSTVEDFARNAGHFRVQDLIDRMRASDIAISRATVYRAINKLLSGGKIALISNEKERYFEFVQEQTHYHFRCKKCGRILEFFFNDIDSSIKNSARKMKVLLIEQKLIIEGFCDRCCRVKNAKRKYKHKK